MSLNLVPAPLHRIVGCLILRWSKIFVISSLKRYGSVSNAGHLILSAKINSYPHSNGWSKYGKFSHKF